MKRILCTAFVFFFMAALSIGVHSSTPGELLIWCDDTRAPVAWQMGEAFTAEFGIPVIVQELAFGDIRDQLGVAGPAGEGPDILIGAHDWLGELVADGLIEPILLGEKGSDFFEVALDSFSWGDDLYAVPYAIESIGLIYNKGLVPSPPATFTGMVDIIKVVNDKRKEQYGFLLPQPDPYHTFPFLSATGGYVFGTDEEGILNPLDIGLNDTGAVTGLQLLNQLIKDGLMPGGVDYTTMTSLFNDGRLGMMVTGPWALSDIRAAGIDYGVSSLPRIEGQIPKPFVGVQGFMISAFSENKMLAQAFLTEYIATEEAMLELFTRGLRPPAYIPAAQVAAEDPDIAGILASAADGMPMPNIPEMAAVWHAWTDALELTFNQELTPREALDNAAQDILAAIKAAD